ncbi:MAG TPA: autotransporter-associated beta strand repeat-containing protein, partial [Candidatus Anammoximicrobium sp.]|nr:autotransporter-associated beta strand repeat-containing protein [Candidatus Anammoximicrobium sp.]
TLTLGAANSYAGGTRIDDGRVYAQNASAFGTGAVEVAAGSYVSLWWNSVTPVMTNHFVLNGLSATQSGENKSTIYANGGGGGYTTYVLTGTITLNGTSNIGGYPENNLLLSGQITGSGGLVKGGGVSINTNTVTLANPLNDYFGPTTVANGTLRLAASEVIPHGAGKGGVTVNAGAVLDLSVFDETLNNLAGGGSVIRSGEILAPVYFTTDAGSGIYSSTIYTHALDFIGSNAPAVVNGYTFTPAGTGGSGDNWTLTGATSPYADSRGGPNAPPTYLDDAGMEKLFSDFYYGGNPATLTLTGLTAGVTYEARLYNRNWDGPRHQGFTFDEDGGGLVSAPLIFDEDGSATPSYLAYRYTAVSDGAGGALPLTIRTIVDNPGGGSYHFYGLTNEEVASPPAMPTLTVGDATSTTFSGTISGRGRLVKKGTGILQLTQANSYPGGTDIQGGRLRIDHGGALGTGPVSVGDNTSLWFWAPAAMTVANDITLNGTSDIPNYPALAQDGGSGLVTLTGTLTLNATSDIGIGGSSWNDMSITGRITGPGGLIVDESSASGNQTLVVSGNNDYQGGTTLAGGRIYVYHASGLGTGAVDIGAGCTVALWWNTGSPVINNDFTLNGIGGVQDGEQKDAIYANGGGGGYGVYYLNGTITLSATSNIGGNNVNHVVVNGRITGPGGLTKGGTRTDENNILTLTNPANDYAGDTSVVRGMLRLGAPNVIPDGPGKGSVTIDAGTTLDLNGFDETLNGLSGAGNVTLGGLLGPVYFTTDFGSGVSPAKTYTHLLDFYDDGVPAVVNGVTFTAAGVGGGAANWMLTGTTNDHAGAGGTIPTYLDDNGMERLLRDFRYGGTPAVVTLSGLTAGVTYETRFYNRQWGGNRTQLFTFDEDGPG